MASKKSTKKSKQSDVVQIRPDTGHYAVGKSKTATGRKTLDVDDKVAQSMRGKSLEDCYKIAAKALGETTNALKAKYGKHNPGMQRMFLGNRMRGNLARKVKKAA